MNLNVIPEGLLATSAAVEALTARLAAAHAAAAPVIGAVVAPGGRSGVVGDRGRFQCPRCGTHRGGGAGC